MTLPTGAPLAPVAGANVILVELVNPAIQLGAVAEDYFARNNIAVEVFHPDCDFRTIRSANSVMHEVIIVIGGQSFTFRWVNDNNHCYIQVPPDVVVAPPLVAVE